MSILTAPVTASIEDGWLYVDAPYTTKPRLDAIKAKWDVAARKFRVPLTWSNCLALRTEFGADLELDPDLIAWAARYRAHARELEDLRGRHARTVTLPDHLPGMDTLYNHQRAGADLILRSARLHKDVGDLPGARYLNLDETGAGKGLPLTSKVLTPFGWMAAEHIREGDLLIGRDGQATKVEGVFPQPAQQTYRVTFSDGTSVVTDGPHLWSVQTSNDQIRGDVWRTMSTEDLSAQVHTSSGRARWRIPMLSAPVLFDYSGDLPMDPYALGVVLGDGTSTPRGVWQVHTDREILGAIGAKSLREKPGCWYGSIEVPDYLGLRGCRSWEKFVPDLYLRARPGVRLALLQGLMDSDGHPMRNGGAEYSSTSERLTDAMVELAQSLGGIAKKQGPRTTHYTHNGERREGRPSWSVVVKLPKGMCPFRLQRKADLWKPPTKYPVTRIIKSIVPEGFQPTVCFRVAAEDSLFVIENYVVTHNTHMALAGASVLADTYGDADVFPMIIVTPKTVVRAWSRLAEQFFPDMVVREVAGPAAKVRKALEPGAQIYVMGYSVLRGYSRIAGYGGAPPLTDEQRADKEIQALDVKTFIVDEAHRVSNPATQQTRAAWAVADGANHVIALTGTPMQDSPENLWAILRMLDKKSFPGIGQYRERYLDMVPNPFGGWDIRGIKRSTEHEFFGVFHTISRRAEKKEVLPFLPPKVYSKRWIELPAAQRTAYNKMAKQYLLETENGTITADNAMVVAGRLIQMSNATLEILPNPKEGEPDLVRMINPSPKVKAFMEDLKAGDYDDTSVVIFSDSRQLLDLCAEAMAHDGYDFVSITGDTPTEERNTAIDRFQSGAVRFILISRAGDTGITLSRASVMVRLTRAWSYITHSQAEDRVHRVGSEIHASVEFVDYITEGTVEEGQIARLNDKAEKATAILRPDELRAMIGGKP
jgi:superfamily II DNA or RNA helicase